MKSPAIDSRLLKEIQDHGPLSQHRFMEAALQTYYRTHGGIGRDFTTAPEISQVFGELIGLWCLDAYEKLGRPETLTLVELGPGKGTLMEDILRVAKMVPSFLQALDIYLVEISPHLKHTQKKALAPFSPTWVETFEEIPSSSSPLLILANEFFDSLPTSFYRRKENRIYERYVDLRDEKLSFTWKFLRKETGPEGTWEESLQSLTLFQAICARLLSQKGAFLCLDYGYETGQGDTLQALYQGLPTSPLTHIGQADLTCHVNFGSFKAIALAQGLNVSGPLPQGIFLKNLHIHERIYHLKQKNPSQKGTLEAVYARLTHPSQMGLLFKALAASWPTSFNPIGFSHEN